MADHFSGIRKSLKRVNFKFWLFFSHFQSPNTLNYPLVNDYSGWVLGFRLGHNGYSYLLCINGNNSVFNKCLCQFPCQLFYTSMKIQSIEDIDNFIIFICWIVISLRIMFNFLGIFFVWHFSDFRNSHWCEFGHFSGHRRWSGFVYGIRFDSFRFHFALLCYWMIVNTISNFHHFNAVYLPGHHSGLAIKPERVSTTPIAPIVFDSISNKLVLFMNQWNRSIFDNQFGIRIEIFTVNESDEICIQWEKKGREIY